jgi:hypothetical protein
MHIPYFSLALTVITLYTLPYELYRVIHKSVKHFKNSQQIDYATDHGNSYADRKRNSPSFFTYFTDAQCVFWGFVKETVFVPALPANLQDLHNCITSAVAWVHHDTLTCVWNEMGYRIDAVLPKVDTMSICKICKKKLAEFLSISALELP